MKQIMLNTPVIRDENGYWSHPDIPDFEEDQAAWKEWKEAQGIELTFDSLESESDDNPAYIAYYEKEEAQVRDWQPDSPENEPGKGDWHTFSIHDTDDGPIWVWARRIQK